MLIDELVGSVPVRGPARRALLAPRRVADYLPRSARPVGALLAAYALLAGVTALGGRRPVIETCRSAVPLVTPWPNISTVAPALVATVLGLAVAALVLRRLVDRPRPAGWTVEDDDRDRRRSAAAVVAACAVLVAGPLAATAMAAGSRLVNGCGGEAVQLVGWLVSGLAGVAGAAACWGLVALLDPRRPA